jgi:hypothetical protein
MNRLDLTGLRCQSERSGRDAEKSRGVAEVEPRLLAWLAVMLVLVAIAVALEVTAHRVRKRHTRKNPGSLGERGRPGSETPDGWRGSGGWDTPSGTRPTPQTARWFRVARPPYAGRKAVSACRLATLPRVGDTLGRETRGAADWPPAPLSQTPDECRTHSAQCVEQAAGADILLLYVDRDDARHFGSLIEAGSALGAGKMV